jgi:hypothetical protein
LPQTSDAPAPPIATMLARYEARFGRPCFEDEYLIVFDVRARL